MNIEEESSRQYSCKRKQDGNNTDLVTNRSKGGGATKFAKLPSLGNRPMSAKQRPCELGITLVPFS